MRKNSRGGYYLPAISKRLSCLLLSLSMLAAFAPIMASAETGTKYGDYLYYEVNEEGTAVTITDCDTTATEIEIPSKIENLPVTNIGWNAFENCYSLKNVAIPDNVTYIGWNAFDGCENLKNVTIPNSVTYIGHYAFNSCKRLTSINVSSENKSYCSIDGNLFDIDKEVLIQYAIGKTNTNYTFPDGITDIGDGAFEYCESLTSITIPDSVTYIGGRAFSCCKRLTRINVSSENRNYCSIDGSLFDIDKKTLMQYAIGKTNTNYTIPDSITSIGEGAFDSCGSLKSITIPDSVTHIGYRAIEDCYKLTDVYYSGTEKQWKSIKRSGGNKSLTNATIHYNGDTPTPDTADTTPDTYDIDEITATETGISFSVTTKEAVSGRQVVMVACYDENGVFTDLKQQEIAASDTAQDIDVAIDKTNSKTVKAFIWNAIGQMMPASRPQSLELQQN